MKERATELLRNNVHVVIINRASQVSQTSACNAGDPGLISGSGRSLEGGNGNPLQYSCLENSVDREAWQVTNSPRGHKESDTTQHARYMSLTHCVTLGK